MTTLVKLSAYEDLGIITETMKTKFQEISSLNKGRNCNEMVVMTFKSGR